MVIKSNIVNKETCTVGENLIMVLPDCFFKKLMYGMKNASWYFPMLSKFQGRDHMALHHTETVEGLTESLSQNSFTVI